jgi:flagellar biosynthesis protein FlhG
MGTEKRTATPSIWAIGGGKGGVGKSVIAANLGVVLAQAGCRVVLVDSDLGGANLHTLLGMSNPRQTLSDFLSRKLSRLDEVMIDTPTKGLWLISGARAPLEIANPMYSQKKKILRHVMALHADHVILDLGAGSAFNVLDFFLVARRGILVVVPEATSVENAYHFLKAAYFRRLKSAEPRDRVREVIAGVIAARDSQSIRSPRDLIEQVSASDPDVGEALMVEAAGFDPALVINLVDRPEHRQLGHDMSVACSDYFGRPVECMGYLDKDELLARSVQERCPAAESYPETPFVRSIRRIADRLVDAAEAIRD